jgi:hypothetical protein
MPTDTYPIPPDDFVPGYVGVAVIGHVIMGDIAVTLTDLATRGLLRAQPFGGGRYPDWILSVPQAPRPDDLRDHEVALLDGIADSGDEDGVYLSDLRNNFKPALERARSAIIQDGIRHGWLHRHSHRTLKGEEMGRTVEAFERELRDLMKDEGTSILRQMYLPYALHFGLVKPNGTPLAELAGEWLHTFKDLHGWNHVVREVPGYVHFVFPSWGHTNPRR